MFAFRGRCLGPQPSCTLPRHRTASCIYGDIAISVYVLTVSVIPFHPYGASGQPVYYQPSPPAPHHAPPPPSYPGASPQGGKHECTQLIPRYPYSLYGHPDTSLSSTCNVAIGHMGPPPAYYDPRVSAPAMPASGTSEAGKVRNRGKALTCSLYCIYTCPNVPSGMGHN